MKALGVLFTALLLFSTSAEARQHHHRHHHHHHHAISHSIGSGTIVAHPAGCPHTLFCGCGASVKLFGHPIRELFLAANWLHFPSAAPAPGMAAARPGHVWVLLEHLTGDLWMGYDPNSGGHQTRIHPRRLAGYRVVNPHG